MSLIVLALVTGYATAELKKHGVPAGVFGEAPANVDERPEPCDADEGAWW